MTTYLITGSNRGIGLEHTKQALAAGEKVLGTYRSLSGATELRTLQAQYPDTLQLEQLDLDDRASITALADRIKGQAIDVLFMIAGLYGGGWANEADRNAQSLHGMDYSLWESIFQANVMGNFQLTSELLANVEASDKKTVIFMSSDLGSIENNEQGMSFAYRSSKAALNMVAKGLSVELKPKGITVISLAPGWVKTDLGGQDARWEVDQSVANQRKVLAELDISKTGQFIDLLGANVPW